MEDPDRLNMSLQHIIQKMAHGHKLKPMGDAGSFFDDGFYLENTRNGVVGIIEVLVADVLELESRELIMWNPHKWEHVLTEKGTKKLSKGMDNG